MSAPAVTAGQVYAEARKHHQQVRVYELADTYQELMTKAHRDDHEAYYTPEPVALFMARFSLDLALSDRVKRIGPQPEQVFRVIALDPSCGCGVFLVEAARKLGRAYAERLTGGEPHEAIVLAGTIAAIENCVFGIDIDPVAVELTRLALSLETYGEVTPEDLERSVICGDALAGDSPPAMEERQQMGRGEAA
jgi:type I restriction-modification system DNA methylase subunit